MAKWVVPSAGTSQIRSLLPKIGCNSFKVEAPKTLGNVWLCLNNTAQQYVTMFTQQKRVVMLKKRIMFWVRKINPFHEA